MHSLLDLIDQAEASALAPLPACPWCQLEARVDRPTQPATWQTDSDWELSCPEALGRGCRHDGYADLEAGVIRWENSRPHAAKLEVIQTMTIPEADAARARILADYGDRLRRQAEAAAPAQPKPRTRKAKAAAPVSDWTPAEPVPCLLCAQMGAEPALATSRRMTSGQPTWICNARGGLHLYRETATGSRWAGWGTGLLPGWRWEARQAAWIGPAGEVRARA